LAAILGQATAGIAALDCDGRFTLVNDRSCQITGYSREELMRLRMMDITHPDDLPRNKELFRTLLHSGQSFDLEKRYLHKDGRIVWVNSSVAAVRDGQGRITAVVAACIDITERRRYEEALRESEGQLRAIYEGGTTYIGWLAPDGTLMRANRASLDFAGSTLEDVIGRPFWETAWFQYTPGTPDLVRDDLVRAAAGEPIRREISLRRPSGETRTFDFSLHPVWDEGGKLLGIVPEGRDITERKRAEEALRESEQRLMLALHASATGVWEWDLKSDRVNWSGHIYAIFGVSAFGGTREDFARFVHPEDATRLWAAVTRALETQTPFEAEFRILRPDGEVRWVSNHASAEYDAAGRPVRLLGTVSDITERRGAEDVLRANKALLQGVTDRARVGLFLVDEEGRLRFGNPAWLEMLGLPGDTEITGRRLRDVIGVQQYDELAPELAKARAGEPITIEQSGAATGAAAPAAECREVHVQPVSDAAGQIRDVLAVVVDISERMRKEKQIKLLMGEVNHRAKNLLGVVQSVARQIARTGDPADYVTRFSQRIMSLAASHDLLVTSQWTGVDLRTLAEAQLGHFKDLIGTRVLLEGPPARLGSAAAQGIGMALHELSTNAGKYGSLSGSRGTVRLSWSVQSQAGQGAMVTLRWEEEGGPEVRPPPRSGFGQLVIGPMAQAAVQGVAVADYRKSGLVWTLEFPAESALEPAH
jgi:PAS domain S-box-containing protein